MLKNFTFGFGAVVALVSIGMATNVHAKLGKAFGVELTASETTKPTLAFVDCEQGMQTLSKAGFDHVLATDCSGTQYRFNGFRGANEYTIVFNAQSNGFAVISR